MELAEIKFKIEHFKNKSCCKYKITSSEISK